MPVSPSLPVVLVLASGRGERFLASGGRGSKLQALLAGQPVLAHTLAAGVRATAQADGWLVLPGDLPLIAPQSLRVVADALQRASIVLPMHRGTRGHPVAFAREHGAALQALTGVEGAAAIVSGAQALKLEIEDAGIVTDIDTVDDLARVEAILSHRR